MDVALVDEVGELEGSAVTVLDMVTEVVCEPLAVAVAVPLVVTEETPVALQAAVKVLVTVGAVVVLLVAEEAPVALSKAVAVRVAAPVAE